MAQRVQRSPFVEQLEQEPDLYASEASPHEAQAAADALAEAARQAVAFGLAEGIAVLTGCLLQLCMHAHV